MSAVSPIALPLSVNVNVYLSTIDATENSPFVLPLSVVIPDSLNLSSTIKLCGSAKVKVTVLPFRATLVVVVGNHKVASKKYSVAAEETTVRYSRIPRIKFCAGAAGFAVGRLVTFTVCPSFIYTSFDGRDGIASSSQGVTHV